MANTIPIRRPIQKSPVKLILYITGIYPASEKVVIVILLARIGVALISVTYVTGPDKTGLIALFCISRNTIFNIECTVLIWWLDTVTPDILYNKCSYIAIIS